MPSGGRARPDARVANRGPDLQNARGANRRGQHPQQRADFRVDERELLLAAVACDVVKDRVGHAVEAGKVALDLFRHDMAHVGYSSGDAPYENYRDRRSCVRHRREARRPDCRGRRHLPPQLFARHPRFAGGDVRPGSRGGSLAPDARSRSFRIFGGPKIRTGRLEGGRSLQLTAGATLRIATGDFVGGAGRISTTFEGLARSVTPGNRLLLADGLIELRVESTNGTEIVATVIEGGELGERKGINAPGVPLPASAITRRTLMTSRSASPSASIWWHSALSSRQPTCSRRAA